jgi:hypothetical protein
MAAAAAAAPDPAMNLRRVKSLREDIVFPIYRSSITVTGRGSRRGIVVAVGTVSEVRQVFGGQFFGVHVSNSGRIMVFAGGVPLKRDGKIVRAIGVSGGSGEQDDTVAEAGAAAF